MKKLIVTYEAYDLVVVPFPFTDSTSSKRRPALVLSSHHSFNSKVGHSVLAMVTSAKNSSWALDCAINDLDEAGLSSPSIVRMKLFTIDVRLIISKIGHLSLADKSSVSGSLQKLLTHDI